MYLKIKCSELNYFIKKLKPYIFNTINCSQSFQPSVFLCFSKMGLCGAGVYPSCCWGRVHPGQVTSLPQGQYTETASQTQIQSYSQFRIMHIWMVGGSQGTQSEPTQVGIFEPRTYLLWGNNANHCTTTPHHPILKGWQVWKEIWKSSHFFIYLCSSLEKVPYIPQACCVSLYMGIFVNEQDSMTLSWGSHHISVHICPPMDSDENIHDNL